MTAQAAGPRVEEGPPRKLGRVASRVSSEFPGLGISWVEVEGRPGRSPKPVRHRLRELSDRFYGSHAVHMRERPIPWAYRVFFRQIGLDPDQHRTPIEQLVMDRLRDGAFKSGGLPADALTVATAETGIAMRAFDADRVQGTLCIRDTAPGESMAGYPGELAQGTLVVADEREPVGLLFGGGGEGRGVESDTRRIAIAAVQVKGVPQIAVDEALWIAAATLSA